MNEEIETCQAISSEPEAVGDVCPHARAWASEAFANDVAYLLNQAAATARDAVAEALAPTGVSVRQMAVMRLLSQHEPLRQHELGSLLGIDRTSMVAVIDGLEALGLAAREADPADRRAHAVRLTRAGIDANARIDAAALTAEDSFLRPLTADQRETLRSILGIIVAAVPG